MAKNMLDEMPINIESDVQKRRQGFQKLYTDIQHKIRRAHERSKQRYNLRRRHIELEPGQQGWRRNKVKSDATRFFSAKPN